MGWISGRSDSRMPCAKRCSRYSVAFISGTSLPEASRTTSKYFDGNSFIITPPFSPSAICVTSGGTELPGELAALEALRLVPGLHLRDELGVGALRLDDRDDAHRLARGIAADQPMRQVWSARRRARVGLLHRVLLHEHPAIAAFDQRAHELVGDFGMVRQGHLGWRETAHPRERIEPEDRGEVVLPGAHVEPEVLHGGRRRDRVSPGRAEPFDSAPAVGRAGDPLQAVDHVVRTHDAQSVQQRAGVFEHDPRFQSLCQQRG